MKKIIFLLLLALFFLPDYSSSQVVNYNVTMAPADYDSLYIRDPYATDYYSCVFKCPGYPDRNDALIRFKGATTRLFPKKGFRIKFSSLWNGMKSFKMNPMFTDKSFIREKLCWDLFKRVNSIAPDPLCFVSFTINDVPKGVYLWIDNIDKYFYTLRGRASGPTYEANGDYSKADLTIQTLNKLKLYYTKQVGDTNYYTDLQNMITELNNTSEANFPAWLNNTFEVNSVYNWLAINCLVQMSDCYTANYDLYRDTTKANKQWYIIPWDYDMAFGRDGDGSIPYPDDELNDGFCYDLPTFNGPDNVLKDRVINNAVTGPILKQRVKDIIDSVYTEQIYYPKIDSLKNLLANEVANDPLKWGTVQDFNENIEEIKYFINARKNFIYNTYVNAPSGDWDIATIHPTQLNVPYRFIDYGGFSIATMTFKSLNLDSIQVRVYKNSTYTNIPDQTSKRFIKRYYKITPYPASATFNAKIQLEYLDYIKQPAINCEVQSGVQDERLVRSYCWKGSSWTDMQQSSINPYSNTIIIDNFNQSYCTANSVIAFFYPTEYPAQFWFKIPNNYWQRLYDIKFANANTGYMVGEQSIILKTVNGGLNWTSSTIGNNLYLYKLAVSGTVLYAACEAGHVFKSSNSGNSWTSLLTGVTQKLNSINFINANEGWAVGDNGCVIHTTNGGSAWSSSAIDTAVNLNALEVFGTAELVTAGSNGKVYTSTNSGASWSPVITGTTKNIYSLKKSGDSYLLLSGDSNLVMYSRTKGQTWNNISVSFPSVLNFKDAAIIDTNRIYVCGDLGSIFYSPNKGLNWFGQYTAISSDLNALYFIDSTKGICSGAEASVLKADFPGTTSSLSLAVTALLSGYYNGTTMVPKNVTVELHNASTPYALVESKTIGLSSSGTGTPVFTNAAKGIPYYIVVKFDNGLETWSATTQTFTGSTLTYDFTSAATQAFGSNMLLVGTKWCIISGDANQDCCVDALDRSACWNDRNLSGVYVTDLNGDGVVDALDRSIAWNNRNLAVQKPALMARPSVKQNNKSNTDNLKGKYDLKLDGSNAKKVSKNK